MRLDKSSRRMRCASKTRSRLTFALLILPVLAGLARADELPLDVVNPKGHIGDVLALGFTPDGKTLITTGSAGLAKIWDISTTTVRADLTGHEGKVVRVAISSDGKTIATGGEDRTVRLWSTKDGAPLGTLSGHSGAVTALAFAPDGKTLASGSPDTTIRLWDVEARRHLRTLEGHEAGVHSLAFSPDSKTLASASLDGTIRLWDAIVERPPTLIGQQKEPVWCVAFAPDGKTVVSGGMDKAVRFWPIGEPKPKPPQGPQQQPGLEAPQPQQPAPSLSVGNEVLAIAFAPDGMTLAAAVSDARRRCRLRVRSQSWTLNLGESSGARSRATWVQSGPWRSRPTGKRSPRAAPIARSGSGTSHPGRREPSGWGHAPPDPCKTES